MLFVSALIEDERIIISPMIAFKNLPESKVYSTSRPIFFTMKCELQRNLETVKFLINKFCSNIKSKPCKYSNIYDDILNFEITYFNNIKNSDVKNLFITDSESVPFLYILVTKKHATNIFVSEELLSFAQDYISEIQNLTVIVNDNIAFNLIPHINNSTSEIEKMLPILFVQMNKYESLYYSCQNKYLNRVIINDFDLKKQLIRLRKKILSNGFDLLLGIENIDVYYSYKLVDCLFSNNKILIGLHIPFMKKFTETKLLQMKALYFTHNDTICRLSYGDRNIAVIKNKTEHKLGEKVLLKNIECNLFIDNMCYLSEFEEFEISPCLLNVLEGNTILQLKQTCDYKCEAFAKKLKIQQITYNTFLVSNNFIYYDIICVDMKIIKKQVSVKLYGAVSFIIKCHCQVFFPEYDIVIKPENPCLKNSTLISNVDVTIIFPLYFTEYLDDFLIHSHFDNTSRTTFISNITKYINKKSSIHIDVKVDYTHYILFSVLFCLSFLNTFLYLLTKRKAIKNKKSLRLTINNDRSLYDMLANRCIVSNNDNTVRVNNFDNNIANLTTQITNATTQYNNLTTQFNNLEKRVNILLRRLPVTSNENDHFCSSDDIYIDIIP